MSLRSRVRAAARRRAPSAALATLAVLGASLVAVAPPAAAATTAVALNPTQVSLAGSGYDGHSVFENGDVAVSTDALGGDAAYATGSFAVDVPLGSAGTPVLSTSGGTGTEPPDMRLRVDFDGDGLPDGTLVGTPDELPAWSLTSDSLQFVKNAAPHTGDGETAPEWYGSLAEWSSAFPAATILGAGYSLGPDATGAWKITALRVGSNRYTFSAAVPGAAQLGAADLDAALADDGPGGHIFFDLNRLRVYTDDATASSYVTQYLAPAGGVALGSLGQPALTWVGDGAAPLPVLLVDVTGDGTPDVQLSLTAGSGDNWSAPASAPIYVKDRAPSCNTGALTCVATATAWNGTLTGWQSAFPDATAVGVGFALGPGEHADGDIAQFVAGATAYTFANTRPSADDVHLSTAFQKPVSVDLGGDVTDPDPGQTMTYGVSQPFHGSVQLTGTTARYQPDSGFAGSDSFTYTVDDGVTAQVSATVYVTVAKASSTVGVRFRPRRPTPRQIPVAHVSVGSAGAVDGGTVTVHIRKRRWHATVSDGTAAVPLRRYGAGSYAVTVTFAGTSTAAAGKRTATLHVD